MTKISIDGLDKASVLIALYNRARPQGLGYLHYTQEPMTEEIAHQIIEEQGLSFDYLKGRVMKVNISRDEIYAGAFDRDNGAGAAEAAINELRLLQDAPAKKPAGA